MKQHIGDIIRKLRKEKNITLINLAKKTGVAQATLSRIETGIMTGTVASHNKIAAALGTTVAELYKALDSRINDIKYTSAKDSVTTINNNVNLEVLISNASNKKIAPVLYTLNANAKVEIEALPRETERFYWVVKGNIVVKIKEKDKEFNVGERESIYFDASLSHELINTSNATTEVFCVTSPALV